MPRKARTRAESGIYYVNLRGINCQQIFADEEENEVKAIGKPSPMIVMNRSPDWEAFSFPQGQWRTLCAAAGREGRARLSSFVNGK